MAWRTNWISLAPGATAEISLWWGQYEDQGAQVIVVDNLSFGQILISSTGKSRFLFPNPGAGSGYGTSYQCTVSNVVKQGQPSGQQFKLAGYPV